MTLWKPVGRERSKGPGTTSLFPRPHTHSEAPEPSGASETTESGDQRVDLSGSVGQEAKVRVLCRHLS